jgi:hypothetical protein
MYAKECNFEVDSARVRQCNELCNVPPRWALHKPEQDEPDIGEMLAVDFDSKLRVRERQPNLEQGMSVQLGARATEARRQLLV